jgi:hypothetical protein
VAAFGDLDRRVPEGARERMDPVECGLVQLQDQKGSQAKGAIRLLDVTSNNFERLLELADSVLGFSPRDFVRVGDEVACFGEAVAISGHPAFFSSSSFWSTSATSSRVIRSFSICVLP